MSDTDNTTMKKKSKPKENLLPIRHPNLDFFACDMRDVSPRDDQESMEHPMFSLSTKPDSRVRHYEHKGNSVTIAPGAYGLATIFDKDVLIYCVSQLIEALDRGRDDTNRTVRVTAYDLLVATNRDTGGKGYKQLRASLRRLGSTFIETNIRTNGTRVVEGFGLIDSYHIVEKSPTDERMVAVEITLSKWLYNAVLGNQVLTIHQDYFRLRKPLERRLYELARKHCGRQPSWKVSLDLLWKKSGANSKRNEFRRKVFMMAESNNLPDYRMLYDQERDSVTFYNRDPKGHKKQVEDKMRTATRPGEN